MEELPPESPDQPVYTCPSCGQLLTVEPTEETVQCPHCGGQFIPAPPEVPQPQDDELSERRIRNIANLRRAVYRTRSWLIIAAGLCLVAAVKLLQIAVVAFGGKLFRAGIVDCLLLIAAVILTFMLWGKIREISREIRKSRSNVSDTKDAHDSK